MPTNLTIQRQGDVLTVALDNGQSLFVLGANGTGKSSLMHRFYSANRNIARRISAHRQTWFSSGSVSLSPEQKRQSEQAIMNTDVAEQARWKDDYSAQRASIAIYDLIDAENVRARSIAAAVDSEGIGAARLLSKKDAPIKIINELLRQSNIPIEISVRQNEQVLARRSGSEPYSVAELSDGERNALLVAANVLTAAPGTLLLIDEPERHLHRSIISPLLSLLFAKRMDCAFVVSTHDVLLPLDNPNARTVLLRGYTHAAPERVAQWDADLVPAEAPIRDEIKKDILGSRRKVIFVEGDERSLDKPLYSLIFPEVSIVSKSGCREVETAVTGIRGTPDLHWVHAFGIVDNDRRVEREIDRLKAGGIYALPVYSVESVYYHPSIQERVATRHAQVTGEVPADMVAAAKVAALAALAPHVNRLSARAVEKTIQNQIDLRRPTQTQIADAQPINIDIDVAAALAAERVRLNQLLAAEDLETILCRYPVRETAGLTQVARALGFQDRGQYENAVRKLLMDDSVALDGIRALFATLYADITA
jgi:ABC-type cobalamin/Fe3+-siderophores transport system ATPase subunit